MSCVFRRGDVDRAIKSATSPGCALVRCGSSERTCGVGIVCGLEVWSSRLLPTVRQVSVVSARSPVRLLNISMDLE